MPEFLVCAGFLASLSAHPGWKTCQSPLNTGLETVGLEYYTTDLVGVDYEPTDWRTILTIKHVPQGVYIGIASFTLKNYAGYLTIAFTPYIPDQRGSLYIPSETANNLSATVHKLIHVPSGGEDIKVILYSNKKITLVPENLWFYIIRPYAVWWQGIAP